MLTYAVSLGALGGKMTPALADAFRRSSVQAVEVAILAADQDDRSGGPTRRLIRQLLWEGAIQVKSIHLPFGGEWDISTTDEARRVAVLCQLRDLIDRSVEFGTPNLTLHASGEPIADGERPARMGQAVRSVAELADYIRNRGFRLAVEWLPRSCLGRDETELMTLVGNLDSAQVGLCFDVNHVMGRHAELPRLIEKLRDRLQVFHISDYDGVDEQHGYPGQGVIDWPAVMRAIRATGLDLTLIYETGRLAAARDPVAALRLVEENVPFLEHAHEITH